MIEVEIVTTDPMCPGCDELREALDTEIGRNRELHRRCQLAEGAVQRKMKAEQAAGAPLAKRLALAGYAAEQEQRLECERKLEALKTAVQNYLDAGADPGDEIRWALHDALNGPSS
jgi:hypothetical protein